MLIKVFFDEYSPVPCETEVVPEAGKEIYIKHHKHEGTYVVNRVETKYQAAQAEDGVGSLKLEADIRVYLTKK